VKPLRVAILTTDKRDHDRDYADPQPGFGAAPAALLQGFAMLPEVELHVVSCVHQPVIAPEKIGPNVFYHRLVVPKLGWMRTLYTGCVRATRRKLREISPAIVHGQGSERDCAIAAVRSGFPNVVTIHGNMKAIAQIYDSGFGSFHWLAARLETAALKRTGGVFCNSAYTERLVASRTGKTWRVPNALRADFFSPVPERKPAHKPVILNIGVIEPRKQQVELLEVARRLHARGLKFELQFIGRPVASEYGRKFGDTLAVAEKAGYARQIGSLTTSQVIAAMDAAHALVHFPNEEAFGLVVAEALARNLKLFGAATGGIVDIGDGVPGAELFPAADFMGLESALADWLARGCVSHTNTAELMQARYHPKIIAQRHLEIYREVLGA